jgi:4-amino-4-deoxy-L-arabinose transferase-like glycosyltransferase
MSGERNVRLALALFILALAVRLLYLHEMRGSPFFDVLYPDALRYDGWAKSIVFGGEGELEPTFRAPLYPLFLAGIYTLAGHSLLAARFAQMLLGALSAVLIFKIALPLFGKRVALASGLIWAFYGPAIYWAGELLIETLAVFLDLLALYVLVALSSRPGRIPWLIPGFLIGLSAIARPNILIFVPFVLLWIFFLAPRPMGEPHASRTLALARALLFVLGVCLPIAPVTLKNSRAAGDFILISSQGGINFYMGNNSLADGKTAGTPERGGIYGEYLDNAWVSSVRIAEAREGKKLSPREVSDFWYSEGRKFILQEPLRWAKLMAAKLGFFWSGTEVTNNEDTYFFRRFSRTLSLLMWQKVISFPFGVVSPLAVLGVLLSLRRWRELSLAYGLVFLYTISVILYFVCGRYRLPVVPFLLMFACSASEWIARNLWAKQWRKFLLAASGAIVLGIFANLDFGAVTAVNRAQAHYLCGWAHHQKGELDLAEKEYAEVLDYLPDHLQAHNNLGLLSARKGDYGRAILEFTKAVTINPGDAMAHFFLGNAYLSAGMYREAAMTYERVLALDPAQELAAYRAGLVYLEQGEREKAIEKWRQCLGINPGNEKAREALAEFSREIPLE